MVPKTTAGATGKSVAEMLQLAKAAGAGVSSTGRSWQRLPATSSAWHVL